MDVSVDTTLNTDSLVLFGLVLMLVAAFYVFISNYAKTRTR